MSVVVFLGPSLSRDKAERILVDAHYLPPAAAGDVYRAVRGRADLKALVLIDGLFHRAPAVWHKELLFALSRGVHVYGASSMGALRAAELSALGMTGVGRIFERFLGGELEDDDEVALIHGPAESGFFPLSDPMVNLRYGLSRACEAGVISASVRDRAVSYLKGLYYPNRSWRQLAEAGPSLEFSAVELAALREFVTREKPDLKRLDAEEVLTRVATELPHLLPSRPSFDFEPTKYWEQLVEFIEREDSTVAL